MVPLSYYLVLSGILFACGILGFLMIAAAAVLLFWPKRHRS